MNDQLQSKMVEVIASIQSGVSRASDFAIDQLPDVVQQYIAYGRVSSIFFTLIPLAIAAMFAATYWWNVKHPKIEDGYRSKRTESQLFIMSLCIILSSLSFLVFCYNLNGSLMVWVAPKVWVIHELAAMVRPQ